MVRGSTGPGREERQREDGYFADDIISFEFREIREADIRAALAPGYRDALVQFCVEQNGKPK
jgi:hypothetical protein